MIPVVQSFQELAALWPSQKIALAFGVFDGVHIGHQKLIQSLKDFASANSCKVVVATFEPNPIEVLAPDKAPQRIVSALYKAQLLKRYGVDACIEIPFDEDISKMLAEEFLEQCIFNTSLNIKAISVGSKWRFGFRAQGNVALLKTYRSYYGFELLDQQEIAHDKGTEDKVSSTDIRAYIESGDLVSAKRCLGRGYAIYGVVEKGLGFATAEFTYPTANIKPCSKLTLTHGVYLSKAKIYTGDDAGKVYPAISYIGKSPTLHEREIIIETHLYGYKGSLYHEQLEVEFLQKLRDEQVFSSRESLHNQILADINKGSQQHHLTVK